MKQGMIQVYTETLILTNDDEGFEKLANVINFRVSGGIFLQWNLSFLTKGKLLLQTYYGKY